MPRIAPEQLIKCLAVLLTPAGGIKSTEEVGRLVQLMQKFSKKLVSKCVYVSILKNTELGLLSDFMEHGGWALVFTWLQKAIDNQNQFIIQEILDLLVLCPVDVTRLKSNNIPKLVKNLSKNAHFGGDVQELAARIVAKWLAIVKGVASGAAVAEVTPPARVEPHEEVNAEPAAVPVLKITLKKDGRSRVRTNSSQDEETEEVETRVTKTKRTESSRSEKTKSSKDVKKQKSSSSSTVSESKHRYSSSSSGEKHRSSSSSDKSKSSRDKEKDRSSKSSSSSSSSSNKNYLKERERERERTKRKEKEKEEKESKLTKIEKDRQVETDQATLARLMVPSINKLGKIPKKTDKEKINQLKESVGKSENSSEKKEKSDKVAAPESVKKNYSFSIEKRTPSDQKPKTVKTFNAKFRSTGLEEETTKPPLPRSKNSSITSSSATSSSEKKSVKRPSPAKDLPPEKKLKSTDHSTSGEKDKSSHSDKVKVTPPKPKVMFLQESDVFSSALNDAILVKETKKKKRKLSVSKDDTKEKENKVTTPTEHKTEDNKPAFKFYRDTLESIPEEKKNKDMDGDNVSDAEQNLTPPVSPTDDSKPATNTHVVEPVQLVEKCNIELVSRPSEQPIKGVLSYLKNAKRPKKSVQFRTPETGLEDVFYFELDETERCNVSRAGNSFTDMRSMERELERENFHAARKLSHEDTQAERTVWTSLIPIDMTAAVVEFGKNSREREVQKARQMTVKPTIYGGYNVIPPSPAEPDFEIHATTNPMTMPTEDSSTDGTSTYDYRANPWPEPLPSENFFQSTNAPPPLMPPMIPGPGPMGMMPPGMFPPQGPFPPGPVPPNPNWMVGPPGDMPPQAGGIPMGPMPPFPPGMGPPMGMNMPNMGPMSGPMPPEMMMNGPPGFMGPPGMFMGPPGWFPGMDMNQGPPDMNQGPPMNDNINQDMKTSSRNKSGGSWHRGGGEPSRDRDRRDRERDKRGGGGRPRSSIPCRHKKFCKTRDCPYMHPSSR